jgi:hypothetical protein
MYGEEEEKQNELAIHEDKNEITVKRHIDEVYRLEPRRTGCTDQEQDEPFRARGQTQHSKQEHSKEEHGQPKRSESSERSHKADENKANKRRVVAELDTVTVG